MTNNWIKPFSKDRWLSSLSRMILGGIFLVAGAGKLPYVNEFFNIVLGYGILPENLAHIYATLLPCIEIVIGLLLILGILPRIVASLSILIILSFITANVHTIFFGAQGVMCGCFGEVIPLTHMQSLITNIFMLSISISLIFRPSFNFNMYLFSGKTALARVCVPLFLIIAVLIMSLPTPVLAGNDASNVIQAVAADSSPSTSAAAVSTSMRTSVKSKLLYFYNEQCPSCMMQTPIIDTLEEEYNGKIIIERLNGIENKELLREYNITSVPTMVIFKNSQPTNKNQYEKFTGYTKIEILKESLGISGATSVNLKSRDTENVNVAKSNAVIAPPVEKSDDPLPARIVTPNDVKEAVSNMVAPYGQILEWGGTNIFGANAGITIDWGTILPLTDCGTDGVADWIYPYSDIYIVPSGSVSMGSALEDAGGSPNTIWGASGGIFVNATLGYTSPGGTIGPGTYAIVYDECQNGIYDEYDALFDPAFEVVISADVPPLPASFTAIKQSAGEQQEEFEKIKTIFSAYFADLKAIEKVKSVPSCVADPAGCLLKYLINKIKEKISASLGISMNAEKETMTYLANTIKHYQSIKADPPDPDFRHLTPLSPVEPVDAESSDPLLLATADYANSLAAEGALAEAFLKSLERYQGADNSSDGEWALIHARSIKDYAASLAGQLAASNAAITALNTVLTADTRPLDDMASVLEDFREDIAASGFSDNETLYLKNLGFSDEEIDELAGDITDTVFSDFSKAAFSANLADIVTANTAAITGYETFVADMDALIATLLTTENVFQKKPVADAGGPYTAAEGASLTLDGSGSTDPDDIVTEWAWDLDLDGEFNDASGETPSVSFDHAFQGLIGLMVTDNTSRSGIGYAFITITNVNSQPVITAYTPDTAPDSLELGTMLDFSVTFNDPESDAISVQWTIDGAPAGTGSSFSYTPTDAAEIGMRIIRAQVSDDNPLGGMVSHVWGIPVMAEDADDDGWHANLDCDEGNPAVNPGMTEITGNGIDDDCDPMTADVPATAAFSYSPVTPVIGDEVTFTDESTKGENDIVAWSWNFGDGGTSDQQNPTHIYTDGGSFAVTLRITDSSGGVVSTGQVITVLTPPNTAFTTGKAMDVAAQSKGATIIGYSSVYPSDNYLPEKAIDGITNTYWRPLDNYTTDQWLKIALAGETGYIINKVSLYSSGVLANIRNFEIRVSNSGTDDADFTTVLSAILPQEYGFHDFSFEPVAAKYVMLYIIDNWDYPSYLVVNEIQVLTMGHEGGIVSLLEGLPATIVDYSGEYDINPPKNLLDDDTSFWRTAYQVTTDQWVNVELGGGASHIIERVILDTTVLDSCIRDFEIMVSHTTSDDAAFTTVFTGTALNIIGEQEFAFAPVEARYVKLYVINNHGGTYIRETNLKVLTPERVNVADGTGVGAAVLDYSSQYSITYKVENAYDFNTSSSSFWRTATGQATNQWVKVRLIPGGPFLIDRIKINTYINSYAPRNFEIRVSSTTMDDAAFETVYSGTLDQSDVAQWAIFPPTPAKYVHLHFYDNYGGSFIQIHSIRIFSPQLGGAVVPFTDLSSDENLGIVAWNWDFGDGETSTEQTPLHVYATPGTYTVTLTTTDNDGLSSTTSMDYTVLHNPMAEFTWSPATPDEGSTASFTDISTDTDGLVLGWRWQYSHTTTEDTTKNCSEGIPDNGDYNVTLTVTDSQFLSSTITHTLTALNVPPVMDAGRDVTVFWGQDWATALDGFLPILSKISDKGTIDAASLILDWDFGDGETLQVLNATSVTSRVSHSFASPGIFVATATVTDKDGASDTDNLTATVAKRGTIQKIYTELTNDTEGNIKVISKLWDTFNIREMIEGREITITLGGQTTTVLTDSEGYATVYFTGSGGDTITAEFTGDEYYEGSSTTSAVGTALNLPVGDVIFAIDESGTMSDDIAAVKANVANIAAQLSASIDYQLALVGFGSGEGDHWESIFPHTMQPLPDGIAHLHSPLSNNVSDFNIGLDGLDTSGGYEPGFNAVVFSTSSAVGYFREQCPSCVILITDEPATTNISEDAPETKEDAITAIEERNAIFFGIVASDSISLNDYGPYAGSLADATGGEVFNIRDFRSNPEPVLAVIMEKCINKIIKDSSANLSISMAADPEPVFVSENLTYTIEITNEGPAKAIGVTVNDMLSENVTFVSATASQGSYNESSGNITFELGTIDIDATATVTIVVIPTVAGNVTNTASVNGERFDPDESNNSATVTSTVILGNRAPVLDAIGDKEVDEGDLLSFTINATDPDKDDELEFLASNLPDGAAFDTTTHVFSWTPGFDQAGNYTDVHFEVSDGLLSDSENVTITVHNVNRAPVADNITVTTDEDIPVDITLTASDADDDDLTYSIVTPPANGTLSGDAPNLTYTPDTGFSGSDNFTYKANDGIVDSNVAMATITVDEVNQAPQLDAIGDKEVNEGELLSFTVNATDPDKGDELEFLASNLPDGAAFDTTTHVFSWTPGFDQAGNYTDVHFEVSDGLLSDSENITITVKNVNRIPVADNITATTDEDIPVDITLTASDADDDDLTYSIVTPPANGNISGDAPNLTYTPDSGFSGSDNFTYKANDGIVDSNVAMATITVDIVNESPVASAGGPYIIDAGDDLYLDGTGSTDPDAVYGDSIVLYEWDFNNDGSYEATGSTVIIPWATLSSLPQPGIAIPLTLRVTDTFGASDSDTTSLTIYINQPVAAFTAIPNPATPAQIITFNATDSSHGHPAHSIVLYEWDFDDDGTFDQSTTDPVTTHSYATFGVYTVTLQVSDDNAPAITDSTTVVILVSQGNRPPVADAGGPYTIDEGNDLTLDASGSSDPDAAYGDSIVAYEWDIDSDGQYDDDTGVSITLDFNDDGSYVVGLRVTDSFGESDTAAISITVNDLGPTAAFTWSPEPQVEGEAITFTDTSTSSPDVIVAWDWNFGDGNTGTGTTPQHTYSGNGAYTVTLTVTDDDGSTDSVSHDITINGVNTAPIADNIIVATDENVPVDITLTASDADDDDLTFSVVTPPDNGTLSGDSPNLTYTPDTGFSGSDNFTYKANDGTVDSNVALVTITITSGNLPPVISTLPTDETSEGSTLIHAISFTDANTTDTHAGTIDWGDGSPSEALIISESDGSGEASPSHIYQDNGSFIAIIKVCDVYNACDSVQVIIQVNNVAPLVNAGGSANIVKGDYFTRTGSFTDPGADDWSATVDYGDCSGVQPLTFNQDKSFTLNHIYVNSGSFTITVKVIDDDGGIGAAAICLVVKCATTSYTITATAGSGGSISPSGTVTVASGADQTFTITAYDDYQIAGVQVDGISVGQVTSYTFTDVTACHTINVFFNAITNPQDNDLLIKHLHISWDKGSPGNSGIENDCDKCQEKYETYLDFKARFGENDEKTQSKYCDYMKCREKYGCDCPPSQISDFHANGAIKIPDGYDISYLGSTVMVTLTISGESLSDQLVFTKWPSAHGAVWHLEGESIDNLNGIGLDIEKVTLLWAPDMGKWNGWAGFHVIGKFIMPEDVTGNTQPPEVNIAVNITTSTGLTVTSNATVLCNVSGNGTVWQYNAHTGWANFPFELLGENE